MDWFKLSAANVAAALLAIAVGYLSSKAIRPRKKPLPLPDLDVKPQPEPKSELCRFDSRFAETNGNHR